MPRTQTPAAVAAGVDQRVGANIRRIRETQNKTREGLCPLLGVTYQQLAKYESGTNRISVGRFVLIARALGVTVETLLEGT